MQAARSKSRFNNETPALSFCQIARPGSPHYVGENTWSHRPEHRWMCPEVATGPFSRPPSSQMIREPETRRKYLGIHILINIFDTWQTISQNLVLLGAGKQSRSRKNFSEKKKDIPKICDFWKETWAFLKPGDVWFPESARSCQAWINLSIFLRGLVHWPSSPSGVWGSPSRLCPQPTFWFLSFRFRSHLHKLGPARLSQPAQIVLWQLCGAQQKKGLHKDWHFWHLV